MNERATLMSQDMSLETIVVEQPPQLRMPARLAAAISSFPAIIVAVLVGKVYWTCRDNIADPDLWWHLRNAQYLTQTLSFPRLESYSFTAAGWPRINHEWLSELFYYAAFRALGLEGIFIVFASVLAVLVVAVFCLCRKETKDPVVAGVATLFGGFLAMVGFAPRTEHFAWVCFVAMYALLLRFRSGKPAPLWLIPILFAIWINCHGSWLIGLSVYAIFLLSGLIRRDIGRLSAAPWSNSELKKLIVTGVASLALLFANPYGYRLVLYPFDTMFHQKLNVASVTEWASVDFNDARGKLVTLVLGVIFAITLISRKRWRIDDALLTAFVLYCGIAHIRFLMLAGIVLPPILAAHLGRIRSYDPRHERRFLNSALVVIILGVCVLEFPSAQMLNAEVAQFFPVRATEFLRTHPQRGHLFNLYQWGGYLEWNLPQAPTFIDGRADPFEYKGVLKDYMDIATLNNSQEILDRYQVTNVLYPVGTPLSYFLSKSSQWERIYSDGQSVIYRRRSS
jgi:hypothetical protein